MFLFTKQSIGIATIFIPISLFYTFLFSFGIGLILASTAVFFRDMLHLYGVLLIIWNYLTPVFYPMEIVPDKYINFINFNPLTYYVTYFRKILIYNEIPDINLNLICLSISLISIILGIIIFKKNQNKFILYV